MFAVDRLILVGAVLVLIGIASSKLSTRMGLPVLVLFLGVGLLAGSEGIGGIDFENYVVAHGVGTIALAIILFDGGLRTSASSLRQGLGPAAVLATAGVLLTSLITGLAATWILDVTLLEGMLLGSIVGSTDAAAVFAILRSKGVNVVRHIRATLEVESASNDPMAIFLTVGFLEVLMGRMELGPDILWFLVRQMGIGAIAGLVVGRAAVYLLNRINLEAAGLYPLLAAGAGFLCYGLAVALGGSGFLAIYIAGILIGNARVVFQRGILLFHDGAAWLAQIVMFVLLGLLAFPSRLAEVAGPGLMISAALIFVARPVTVFGLLLPFRFNLRELTFISWVGLKGAVPIVLATYPLIWGLPSGELLFDAVFFVVLVSAISQGWTLPPFARALGLEEAPRPEPPVALEISSLRDVDADIVEYVIQPESRGAGRAIRELALPDGVVVAMISRGSRIIPPRGSTRVQPGDIVFVVVRREARPLVDRVFGSAEPARRLLEAIEFPLRGDTTISELAEFYGIQLEGDGVKTLDELIRERTGDAEPDSEVAIGGIRLRVREVSDGRVEQVGLRITTPEAK
jgi:cell volume regulation protein A